MNQEFDMPQILVVDDSQVDRMLVGGLLGKVDGLEGSYAEHGAAGRYLLLAG